MWKRFPARLKDNKFDVSPRVNIFYPSFRNLEAMFMMPYFEPEGFG